MAEQKRQVIFFTPNYLHKAEINSNSNADPIVTLENESFVCLSSQDSLYSAPPKSFSKKEQFLIIDSIKAWVKDFHQHNEKSQTKTEEKFSSNIVFDQLLENIEGINFIKDSIKSQLHIEPESFSALEHARQAFLGSKVEMGNFRSNSKIAHIQCHQNQTIVALGDFNKREKIITIDFGIQQISETINSLRKTNQSDSLILFVKANLYRYIELAKYFGKPQLVTFDETSSRLLSQALSEDLKTHRINAEWIQQLCYKIIDTDSQYLNRKSNWINTETLDYTSARIVLLGFLLEGLGANVCHLDNSVRLKGYALNKMIQIGDSNGRFQEHVDDWKQSAYEMLISLNPQDFSRSLQMATLADKLFRSGRTYFHLWTEKERKILWLSAFFDSSLSKYSTQMGVSLLEKLEAVDELECQMIMSIISISNSNNLSLHSRSLEIIPANLRTNTRKLATVVQLARALDVTGRSSVGELYFKTDSSNSEKLLLKISSRLNCGPELIQVNVVKKSFENLFELQLDVELESIARFVSNENASSKEEELIEF
ncbi:MAG: hypothetical protein SFU25_10565 [Candidatus Caenarcaniphilales bacterium]|nr:hypothetical protein [Candidatus Caenarcaniphilales bacterium]